MRCNRIVLALASLAVTGWSSGVAASGFQLLEQNLSGLGSAYAGSAAIAEDASTVFFNPAGLTRLSGVRASGGLALIKPSYVFRDQGSSNAPAAAGSNGGDAGGLAALPNLYASWQLSDRWFAGLGMGTPFGLKTEYDEDWAGRFQSVLFDIKTYNLNPSLAFQVNEKLSLGAGLNWQRMEAVYQRQAATLNAFTQGTQLTLDASGDALGWNAGLVLSPSDSMRIGFSYRSKMFHRLKGTLESNNQLVSPDVDARASITLPDTYILSVVQRVDDRWEMMGDLSRTNWSAIDKVAIVRDSGSAAGSIAQTLDANFRDTWRVALGASYKLNDRWSWRYGIAYDQSPVRGAEERLVSLPDNNRYWFSTGTQWKMNKQTVLDLGVAYLYIPDTEIRADHVSQGQGRVIGEYDGSIFILGAQLSHRF